MTPRAAKHADASESAPSRTVTAILYLNPDWHQGHGGELCLYNHSEGEPSVLNLNNTAAQDPDILAYASTGTTLFHTRAPYHTMHKVNCTDPVLYAQCRGGSRLPPWRAKNSEFPCGRPFGDV